MSIPQALLSNAHSNNSLASPVLRWRSVRWRACVIISALVVASLLHAPLAISEERFTLDQALRETLKLNPATLLERQAVISSRGSLRQAEGQFDTVLNGSITRNHDLRPLRQDEKEVIANGTSAIVVNPVGVLSGQTAPTTPPDAEIANLTSYSVGVQQMLQSGVTVGGGVSVSTLDDNIYAINGIPPQTSGRISLGVQVPLLRNAGRAATTAGLSAADEELSAAGFDLVFAYATALENTAFAYWDYLARWRGLEIAREAEQRANRLAEETGKLINGGQIPKAEMQLVLASVAGHSAARTAAEQSVAEARRNLALQIGLSAESGSAMPAPADEFPVFDGQPLNIDQQIEQLRTFALAHRADVEAAKRREGAARYRLVAAQSGLKPQLDFRLGASYNSLVEERVPFDPTRVLGSQRVGPSVGATLSLQLPLRNSAAEGAFMVQSAALDSSMIRTRSVSDIAGNNVSLSSLRLVRSTNQLMQSIEATRYYRQAVENENIKRRRGASTLIDVLNVEDRLTNALFSEVQAHQNYAAAIAQLRFELGTIVVQQGEQFDVEVNDLFSSRFDIPR